MHLRDIYLGNTDAKNEVLSESPQEIERFLKLYVTPPALDIDRFAAREKYYVLGLKGTGKTALLRFISHSLDQSQNATSRFVLFKSEVDEDLRSDFSRAARVQLVEENSGDFDGDDFEIVWRWFIYRKIGQLAQTGVDLPFQRNAQLANFCALVDSEHLTKKEKTGLMRLIPSLRKGTVEISHSPKLGLELDWDSEGKARIQFNELVRKTDAAFEVLTPDSHRMNLFFDELELNYATKKQHQRDARLVRDLIVTIERLNAVAKRLGMNFCLYAAVRTEVLLAIDAMGKEINKPMADFGAEILWNRPGLSAEQQPLLVLIEQRINTARAANGLPSLSSELLWGQYFPATINNQTPQIYILHNSWYRPRDVVRLLLAVQEQYPREVSFSRQALEAIRKKYSTASWVEMTEELRTKYKGPEIDGIKYLFYGGPQALTFSDLASRAATAAEDRPELRQLLNAYDLKSVLRDLYRIGVIGNLMPSRERKHERDKFRFSFRGDDELLFDGRLFVHNALKAHLSLS